MLCITTEYNYVAAGVLNSYRLRCIKRSIDSIRISERMVSTPGHSTAFGSNPALD